MSNNRHLCNKYLQSACATFCYWRERPLVFASCLPLSSEGTTQGDPLAISLYAISLQLLITLLGIRSSEKSAGMPMMPLERVH